MTPPQGTQPPSQGTRRAEATSENMLNFSRLHNRALVFLLNSVVLGRFPKASGLPKAHRP